MNATGAMASTSRVLVEQALPRACARRGGEVKALLRRSELASSAAGQLQARHFQCKPGQASDPLRPAFVTSALSRKPRHPFALNASCTPRFYSSSATFDTERPVAVPGRAVISLSGVDVIKVLNALITTNAGRLDVIQGGSGSAAAEAANKVLEYLGATSAAQYCAFLNPQGRMLGTAMLFRIADDHVLADVDASIAEELMAHMKKFKLRSKCKIVDATSEYAVVAAWGGVQDQLQAGSNGIVALADDPRTAEMGKRGIARRAELGKAAREDEAAGHAYTIQRMLQGIAESSEEIWPNQSLPLEANVDILHGVDFRKGCYVGQELTARTHHTGVVRKRIVPVSLYASQEPRANAPQELAHNDEAARAVGAALASNCQLGKDVRSVPFISEQDGNGEGRSTRERSAGKMLARVDNVGLALLRLDQVARWGSDLHMRVDVVDGGEAKGSLWLRPFVPAWWPDSARNPE